MVCGDISLRKEREREREREIREKNNPQWFVLANTDGKLAAVITDVVHGL